MQSFFGRIPLAASLLLIVLISGVPTSAQTANSGAAKSKGKQNPPPAKPGTSQSAQPPTQSTAASNIGIIDATTPSPTAGADYIPCKFTYNELQTLVTPERVLTLTPADAEQLADNVIAEVKKQETSGLLTDDVALYVIQNLGSAQFIGIAPSQAVSQVISLLANARRYVQENKPLPYQPYQASKTTSSPNQDPVDQPEMSQTADSSPANEQSTTKSQPAASAQSKPGSDMRGTAQEATSTTEAPPKPDVTKATQSKVDNITAASSQIVTNTQDTVNRLLRPTDVGCAMSVLSWDETRRAYGRIIASVYIAVQIVVRNTNRQQEFLLHDAELNVNVDPGGRVGRFFSGRDKVVVRATATAQQNFDIRNLVVNGAQTIGAIMSAAAIVYGGALSDAANVFNSAFYPSLTKAWKDQSIDQLNLLNDTGFSSTPSSQFVVPKNGTVMFVIFIPVKQFEQGWWTAPCASRIYMGTIADRDHRAMIPLQPHDLVAGGLATAATGVDVQHAIEYCGTETEVVEKHWTYNPYAFLSHHATSQTTIPVTKVDPEKAPQFPRTSSTPAASTSTVATTSTTTTSTSTASTTTTATTSTASTTTADTTSIASIGTSFDVYRPGISTPYKNWSGNALAIFQELSTAVVAGMHIMDDSALQPSLTQLTCDTDKNGKLNFPNPDKGQLTCSLTGKNLDKVKFLRLRIMKDVDPLTADGVLTLSGGDNTTATVAFQTDALHKLTGTDYAVYTVDKAGVEKVTNAAIHLNNGPVVTNQPTPIDESSAQPPKTLVLNGFHLINVQTLTMTTKPGSSITLKPTLVPVQTDTTVTFDLSTTDFTPLGTTAAPATLSLKVTGSTDPVQLTQTVPFTPKGATPKAANTPKAATAPKGANAPKPAK